MEGKESARASPMLSLSMSPGPIRQSVDKKKEFDKRVMALAKEYQELNPALKPILMLEDFVAFYQQNRIPNNERARQIFDELDENRTGQITKSDYIKKCLQVEDKIIAKINEKVTNANVLKTRFEDTVKKLNEAKEVERTNAYGIMDGSIVNVGIVEGKSLLSIKGSPYVVVMVGDQRKSTKYILSSTASVWNEELTL